MYALAYIVGICYTLFKIQELCQKKNEIPERVKAGCVEDIYKEEVFQKHDYVDQEEWATERVLKGVINIFA